jgi:LPS sulfotransferase NodH/SAM-dependent methyltransferase
MQARPNVDEKPIRFVTDERLDFDQSTPLRKSYFITSSYRCGSQYLCWKLWETGVLGAPCEYLNPGYEIRVLMKRFNVFSHADYVAKLLERRTSKNGVFGLKEHFHHFEAFLKAYPALLDALSPVTYIYISRRDKVAQAVSMAKALQTDQWSSRMEDGSRPPLQYDRELIANCLKDLERQDAGWLKWFEARNVAPFQLTYEDLIADTPRAVESVVELLGVQDDERVEVAVPPAKKQSDETNHEWIERFEREAKAADEGPQTGPRAAEHVARAAVGSSPTKAGGHFFDRYDQLIKTMPEGTNSATGFIDAIRLRRRYDAIIAQNRPLFRDARVLDLASSQGFWSLAALDAGAAHVVGVGRLQKLVDAGAKNFADHGFNPESYRFMRSEIFAALETFRPGAFDVILCKGFFEQSHFPLFFHHLARLRPHHVILDTKIAAGRGPMAQFAMVAGRNGDIVSTPNHELIEFLCESTFRWRLVDWQAMGISDWTGVQDYARDSHRTYVLDRLS